MLKFAQEEQRETPALCWLKIVIAVILVCVGAARFLPGIRLSFFQSSPCVFFKLPLENKCQLSAMLNSACIDFKYVFHPRQDITKTELASFPCLRVLWPYLIAKFENKPNSILLNKKRYAFTPRNVLWCNQHAERKKQKHKAGNWENPGDPHDCLSWSISLLKIIWSFMTRKACKMSIIIIN